MLFDNPIMFRDALKNRRVRALLPTTLSSRELAAIGPEITEVAVVMARVTNAKFLQTVQDCVEAVIKGETTEGASRLVLKQKLQELGYTPPEGEAGRITDLSSDQRTNLVMEMGVGIARGYGRHLQGQNEATLRDYPVQELYRAIDKEEPRDWAMIWPEACAAVDPDALSAYQDSGEMIARKDSPVWVHISDFGLAYSPFKYNSGMRERDRSRADGIAYGLIGAKEKVEPHIEPFGRNFKMSVKDLDEALRNSVMNGLDHFEIRDGVLTRKEAVLEH